MIAHACEDLMALEMYRGASAVFARVLAAVGAFMVAKFAPTNTGGPAKPAAAAHK